MRWHWNIIKIRQSATVCDSSEKSFCRGCEQLGGNVSEKYNAYYPNIKSGRDSRHKIILINKFSFIRLFFFLNSIAYYVTVNTCYCLLLMQIWKTNTYTLPELKAALLHFVWKMFSSVTYKTQFDISSAVLAVLKMGMLKSHQSSILIILQVYFSWNSSMERYQNVI